MLGWRSALVLGGIFIVVGLIYWYVQSFWQGTTDFFGPVALVALGVATAFGFSLLLRGSKEL